MRLGDLDALTGKLKNGLGNAKNAGKEDYAKIFEVFIDWVSRESTIDAVPVVRCRECENYDENGDCVSLDLRIGIHSDTINYDFCPDPDFYCAYGRRKIETVLPKSAAKDESLEVDHD